MLNLTEILYTSNLYVIKIYADYYLERLYGANNWSHVLPKLIITLVFCVVKFDYVVVVQLILQHVFFPIICQINCLNFFHGHELILKRSQVDVAKGSSTKYFVGNYDLILSNTATSQ